LALTVDKVWVVCLQGAWQRCFPGDGEEVEGYMIRDAHNDNREVEVSILDIPRLVN